MKIRQAVAVIFHTKEKVFMIKRSLEQRAFPGYLAFVGGRIDKSDTNHVSALKREIQEELKFEALEDDRFRYCTTLISPDYNPIRYETYFYAYEVDDEFGFDTEHFEILEGFWKKPSHILNEWEKGDSLIIPPIRSILQNFPNLADLVIHRDKADIPKMESIHDLVQYMPLSPTIKPATRTNCFLIKGEPRTLVDPSPIDEDELLKLEAQLPKFDQIFITHYHGDHYRFVNKLAKMRAVPIFLSKETHQLILTKEGESYFDGIEIKVCHDQMILQKWKNKDVKVFYTEGHAKGQMSISPSSQSWCIVSDLFQGVGSVVVGGENACMKTYMESLKSIIELNPMCVIPSHGIALGGTRIIKLNLEHRKFRESQIIDLYKKKYSVQKMLKTLYVGLPEHLHKYALANIESHLKKILAEAK